MEIHVTSGTGTGPTALAAFDAAALAACGINHNMVYLSSFIPPSAVVKRSRYVVPPEAWGERLYVVMARQDADEPGQEAWAGLGWVQDESGRGMFVEQHGRRQEDVEEVIRVTLEFMIARRGIEFGPIHHELAGIKCQGSSVSAVVIAVYGIERWRTG